MVQTPLNSLFGATNVEAAQPSTRTQTPSIPSSVPQQQTSQGTDFKQLLLKLGVPLGAAIAGSVNPDILPQTAGLAQGFNKGVEGQKKANRKVFTLDRDGKFEEVGEVPEDAIVRLKTGSGVGTISLTRDEDGVLTVAEPEQKEDERVRVKNNKGQTGTIPRSQLEDAKKQGFKESK